VAEGRPADRPAGLAQTIPVGRCVQIGDQRVWVKTARCGVVTLTHNAGTVEACEDDVVEIDGDTRVGVVWARDGSARLAVDAPRHLPITRPEPSDIP
jgi:hypothetical protein